MKLLTKSKEFKKEFKKLMSTYSKFFWASAWASAGNEFELFNLLKKYSKKIEKIVIGTSFDHTNPEFIQEFINHKNVKFVEKNRDLFHLKIYLFRNSEEEYVILIGSMNFTSAGFNTNIESLLMINNEDDSGKIIYNQIYELITAQWTKAKYFTEEELDKYKLAYEAQKRRSGEFVKNKPGEPLNRVKILNWSWKKYVDEIKIKDKHLLNDRIKLLKNVNTFFSNHKHFKNMSIDERRKIAGTERNIIDVDWALFGRMTNWGFSKKINDNDSNISEALDQIPVKGKVTREDYFRFIDFFKKAFLNDKRKGKITAYRLLAMKRPDIFICLTNKNEKELKKRFVIKGEITFERYWDEIIERIFEADWYNEPQPTNTYELNIWKGRSAFLDSILYKSN